MDCLDRTNVTLANYNFAIFEHQVAELTRQGVFHDDSIDGIGKQHEHLMQ